MKRNAKRKKRRDSEQEEREERAANERMPRRRRKHPVLHCIAIVGALPSRRHCERCADAPVHHEQRKLTRASPFPATVFLVAPVIIDLKRRREVVCLILAGVACAIALKRNNRQWGRRGRRNRASRMMRAPFIRSRPRRHHRRRVPRIAPATAAHRGARPAARRRRARAGPPRRRTRVRTRARARRSSAQGTSPGASSASLFKIDATGGAVALGKGARLRRGGAPGATSTLRTSRRAATSQTRSVPSDDALTNCVLLKRRRPRLFGVAVVGRHTDREGSSRLVRACAQASRSTRRMGPASVPTNANESSASRARQDGAPESDAWKTLRPPYNSRPHRVLSLETDQHRPPCSTIPTTGKV